MILPAGRRRTGLASVLLRLRPAALGLLRAFGALRTFLALRTLDRLRAFHRPFGPPLDRRPLHLAALGAAAHRRLAPFDLPFLALRLPLGVVPCRALLFSPGFEAAAILRMRLAWLRGFTRLALAIFAHPVGDGTSVMDR